MRLTENWDGWRFSAIYENRYDFDGVYRDLAFTSHDVMYWSPATSTRIISHSSPLLP